MEAKSCDFCPSGLDVKKYSFPKIDHLEPNQKDGVYDQKQLTIQVRGRRIAHPLNQDKFRTNG